MDIFQYSFFSNALLVLLLISIVSGVVGTYVVSRRMLFITGGITHISFGGLGLGMYLGIYPLLTALVFAIISALGVEKISRGGKVREDSAIAVFWALGMAIGIIFLYITPGYNAGLSGILFGNVLAITKHDILIYSVFVAIVLILSIKYNKEIIYTAFDREFSMTRGVKVRLVEYMAILVISVTIILSIKLIGIMLLLSFLSLPQMSAELFTNRYNKIVLLSSAIAALGAISGLFLSILINIPTGALIVIMLVVIYTMIRIYHYAKRVKHIK